MYFVYFNCSSCEDGDHVAASLHQFESKQEAVEFAKKIEERNLEGFVAIIEGTLVIKRPWP